MCIDDDILHKHPLPHTHFSLGLVSLVDLML